MIDYQIFIAIEKPLPVAGVANRLNTCNGRILFWGKLLKSINDKIPALLCVVEMHNKAGKLLF
jgi:hypothetical protein